MFRLYHELLVAAKRCEYETAQAHAQNLFRETGEQEIRVVKKTGNRRVRKWGTKSVPLTEFVVTLKRKK